MKNLTNENSSEIIINNLNLLNVNPNNSDNKKQNCLNLYFLLKARLQNLFYYIFKRNTIYYKEQLNKRLGINKKEIQKS